MQKHQPSFLSLIPLSSNNPPMLIEFDRNRELPVIHRDEHLIVVHKPSGMVVHPTDLARLEKVSLMGLAYAISLPVK